MSSGLYTVADGKLTLHFHRGQARAWDSARRFVFMLAGSQGGKTSFGPWWLNREIERKGAGDYLAVTATFDLFKMKLLPTLRDVFEHTLAIGRYWSGDQVIELKNPDTGQFEAKRADDPMWARIILRSAASTGRLESATAKAALLDECGQDGFALEAWEAVLRRLALNQGRALGATTPYNLGWLKQQVFDRYKMGDNHIEVIQFDSTLNPSFPIEEFESRRAAMPAWKFNMFYRGMFDRPAGQIYQDFDDRYRENGGHRVRPFDLPIEWPRFVGVDPGAVHHGMIWLAQDTEHNIFYLYRESLTGGKSTAEHAKGATDLAEKNKERVIMFFVGQKSEVQQRYDWQAAGVPNVSEPPFHDVEGGIDRVIGLLRQHRLYVFDNCRGVLDEIGTYSRELDGTGEPTEKIRNKASYHRLDALRYVVAGVTGKRTSNSLRRIAHTGLYDNRRASIKRGRRFKEGMA